MTPDGTDQPRARRRTTQQPWFALTGAALVAAAISVSLPACSRSAAKPAPAEREPVKVNVLSGEFRDLPRYVRVTGTLHGDEETTVAAKVAGRVIEVAKDLGDNAAPGEILARVDPTDYKLASEEREQAFREVLASIGLDTLPEGTFAVDTLPTVERARLQAENAKARHDRGKVLAERKPPLISDQDFADLKTAWDVAESNLRVEKLGAEATLAEARTLQAQVNVAQQRVADAIHRAPIDEARASDAGAEPPGARRVYEIASRLVSVGDFVQIGTPLFRLVDANPLKLRSMIPERRLGSVKIGQTILVKVESRVESFQGTVSRVSPAVDPGTRNFMVEIIVPNANKQLKPGSFAVGEIHVGTERALVIPENAIITFAGVHKVVVVAENKAQEKRVELGQRIDGMVEVISGLSEDDIIISKPSGALTTGTPVAISAQTTAAQPAAAADSKK